MVLIVVLIISQLGFKFEQQQKLYNRSELAKLDATLRELGVDVCIIQPINFSRGDFIVMLLFWEKNHKDILGKMGKIKAVIREYTKKVNEEIRTPIIEFYDADGFILEDTLKASSRAELDETQPEYHDVIVRFTSELKERLKRNFVNYIESENFHTKIIADVKYDVTLDAYSPKQLTFYVRFNNANKDQLKAVRIQYKRLSGFNEARGDIIHFYNLNNLEYAVIEHLVKATNEIHDSYRGQLKNQTIFYDPLKLGSKGWKERNADVNLPLSVERLKPKTKPDGQPETRPSPDITGSPSKLLRVLRDLTISPVYKGSGESTESTVKDNH
jgi:hypothetical protein